MPVFRLNEELLFPPPLLAEPDGLLAVGGDLSLERLLLAYHAGIFPWYSEGEPILWWAPSPRLILEPKDFHVSKRLARTIRRQQFTVTLDQAFRQVMKACAEVDARASEGTWITSDMITAYCRLHEAGYGHSVECWQGEALVGGLYGVSLGSVFFGESMFSRVTDGSKVALATLVQKCLAWDFDFIDCQLPTPHLRSMGAREMAGEQFYPWLQECVAEPSRRGKWRLG